VHGASLDHIIANHEALYLNEKMALHFSRRPGKPKLKNMRELCLTVNLSITERAREVAPEIVHELKDEKKSLSSASSCLVSANTPLET
jgi:hypothetical protein